MVVSHFLVGFEAFTFVAEAIGKLFEKVKERTKRQIWYLLVYKPMLLDENSQNIAASSNTTNTQVYVVRFEWNRRSLLFLFFLLDSYEKINTSFLRVKRNKNLDYDKNI